MTFLDLLRKQVLAKQKQTVTQEVGGEWQHTKQTAEHERIWRESEACQAASTANHDKNQSCQLNISNCAKSPSKTR